uniref:Ribosomal protein L29 n=1 Tax=Osmundaria fimbriata TaxID=228265 RepID=A0A1Z1M471_OSMFI|nr:ribosomal protein L29 [Osmundaria fimbriata]ARW60877.1 ribosomal protein L29 [Osmundaria fimbriata]
MINNQDITIKNLENEIVELKKKLVILRIEKITKQKIKTHLIKETKHKISQMLMLIKST